MTPLRFTVTLTHAAENDLDEIHRYTAETRSLDAADALLDQLVERAASLATFPLKGSVPRELEALGHTDFRQIILSPYRLIYRVVDATVIVAVIADGRREMTALLERRLLRG